MILGHEWLAREAAQWWPAIGDHLWQSALFVFVVLLASIALNHAPARVRYSFWLVASLKLLVPTTLLVLFLEQFGLNAAWLTSLGHRLQRHSLLLEGLTTPVATLADTYELTVFAGDAIRHNEVYCALTAIWLTGFLGVLSTWGWRRRKLQRALKLGQHVQSGREWTALQRARKSLKLRTDVELIISSEKTEPTVCGVLKPALLLPESVAEHLDDAELETIMLHELVHVLRRDNLIGNFQMAVCAVFWFYPPVWFISRKLFDERELACDEKVLEVYGAPEQYAASILKVVRFCFGWKVAGLAGAGGGSNLRRRIENIMTTNKSSHKARVWMRRLAASLVGLTLVLMVAAGVYSRGTNMRSAISTVNSDHVDLSSTFVSESTAADQKNRKGRETAPPTPPAPPLQEMQPPAPPQGMQPPSAPQDPQPPSPPSQHIQPPSSPQNGQPSSPPSPPSPPSRTQPPPPPPVAPATTQDKKSGESSQDKKVGVVKGELIEAPQPEYPDEAKKQKIEGTVAVRIVIGEEGNVISARATSGPSALYEASVAAARKARFKPSTADGKPVKVTGTMTYNFKLD